MSKYDPLNAYLSHRREGHVPMTFGEIEDVIRMALPSSARRHRAWWSNDPSNNTMTHAWLEAGYRTEAVNLEAERVVFRRCRDEAPNREPRIRRHPVYGCLEGTVTLRPDTDLTAPADPDWGAS